MGTVCPLENSWDLDKPIRARMSRMGMNCMFGILDGVSGKVERAIPLEFDHKICEGGLRAGPGKRILGAANASVLLSYGPFKTFNREPTLSAIAKVFLIPAFSFQGSDSEPGVKDLTQNQECYWPNGDPNSQPLSVSLLQSRS